LPFEKNNRAGIASRFGPGKSGNPGGRPKLVIGGTVRGGRVGLCKVIDNELARAIQDGTVQRYIQEMIHTDAQTFWTFFKTVIMPLLPRESISVTQELETAFSGFSKSELLQIAGLDQDDDLDQDIADNDTTETESTSGD